LKFHHESKKNYQQAKVLTIAEIAGVVTKIRDNEETIALCHGVFDLLHPGHFQHFKEASNLADFLIVSITSDAFVNKGPGRPLFTEEIRASTLAALEMVDYVIVSEQATAETAINLIKPDYYVKGSDYSNPRDDVTGKILTEKTAVENYGGSMHFTGGLTSSSSLLINKFYSLVDSQTQNWLNTFKETDGLENVLDSLEKISNLKVLILGETIIDQYTSCTPLAKSSKDPILAFHQHKTSFFPGGVLAIANSSSSWASKTKVITFSGVNDQILNNLGTKINSNIECEYILANDRPTILKHRYVDEASNARVFEYYDFSDLELSAETSNKILSSISAQIGNFDLVLAADYGHGYFTKSVISLIQEKSSFLAINTQANAGNRGFNTIAKYSNVDVISLNGSELQLELRDRNPDYIHIVPKIIQEKSASYAVVTLGGDGLLVFDNKGNYEKVPAFATKVVDKVGAGDSVFIIASLLAKVKAPLKVIGLLANLVAAHEVSQLGHQKSLERSDLLKHVTSILK
jgi:rfaE bifunctional protein nucleotidyltransferase chain/domain